MHPTANIIAKFGAAIGIDGLETENGVCTLQFDDVTVTLECAETGDALYLYSRVCGLPESDADKLALYGLLLELDSFFKGTDGGVLGIEPLLDAVTYTRRLPLEHLAILQLSHPYQNTPAYHFSVSFSSAYITSPS